MNPRDPHEYMICTLGGGCFGALIGGSLQWMVVGSLGALFCIVLAKAIDKRRRG